MIEENGRSVQYWTDCPSSSITTAIICLEVAQFHRSNFDDSTIMATWPLSLGVVNLVCCVHQDLAVRRCFILKSYISAATMWRVCPPAPNCKKGIAGGLKVIVNKTRSVWGKGDEFKSYAQVPFKQISPHSWLQLSCDKSKHELPRIDWSYSSSLSFIAWLTIATPARSRS